jgi:4'-phosphopantetheinyl transferase
LVRLGDIDDLMMLELEPGQIDLWCSFPSEIRDERLLGEYRSFLSEAERRQEPRFYFSRDRLRYLVTRALVRTVLARYAPIAPRDWAFTTNRYGRPYIANDCAFAQRIYFNVTHTDGLIMLAVARDHTLGIDVENILARRVPLEIADRYFAAEEVARLRSLPQACQPVRFLEYWTLKEAYIKARGMGLSIPLDRFSFRFPVDERIEIAIHPDEQDAPSRWHFWQLRVANQYLAAVCAERVQHAPPELLARQIVPLVSESRLEYLPVRASAPLSTYNGELCFQESSHPQRARSEPIAGATTEGSPP